MSSNPNPTVLPATLFENAFFVGLNLENILYGLELVLYLKTMHVFLTRRKTGQKSDVAYAVFSTAMFSMITIWVSTEAIFAQRMWLINRNFPGGSFAYGKVHSTDLYMDFGTMSSILLQTMTDCLMLYRCRIVWGSRRAIILPLIVWSANFVLGIMLIWASCRPGSDFFDGLAAKLGFGYYTVSVTLNAILTTMICCRLIYHAKTVREYLGEQHASPYVNIIMLLVESVLPYTLCGIAFLIAYGLKSQLAIGFACVYTMMMAVSPQMLILRVAEGKAWHKDSIKPPASVMVAASCGNTSGLNRFDGGGAVVLHVETLQSIYHPEVGGDKGKVEV